MMTQEIATPHPIDQTRKLWCDHTHRSEGKEVAELDKDLRNLVKNVGEA